MAIVVAENISFEAMGNTLPPLEKWNSLRVAILSILLREKVLKQTHAKCFVILTF